VNKFKVRSKELARISRETQVWKEFFKLFISKDCRIIIRSFPFNPNNPAHIFQLDILAAFAEYESNQTSRRVRESVFAAMLDKGKFNSTHRVLGLKQLILNGVPQVGFYEPNFEELKTVIWIMETFVKYGSYSKTLEECERRRIKNWTGASFKTHALGNLLTNTRYIGQWAVNTENKDKDKDERLLMPYDK
jgi:DNA invertase Pin-like site-specific DNA recombinase